MQLETIGEGGGGGGGRLVLLFRFFDLSIHKMKIKFFYHL